MKAFFEGDSIVEMIKQRIAAAQMVRKAKCTDVFLTPIETQCLQRELDTDILDLEDKLKEVEGFGEITFHFLAVMF